MQTHKARIRTWISACVLAVATITTGSSAIAESPYPPGCYPVLDANGNCLFVVCPTQPQACRSD